ncbi:Crp/Fnr family transcriptional regulator [Echinicola salinicaeni]|uniref:Crp/Fnr family transcriptional regulator n=1 Tax=Echinicola salinicaeni TaxID=2762757 RepID=UPI0016478388|nr:Crp/Fnr family transcriptional regulator [Echinicola salinicaeni]
MKEQFLHFVLKIISLNQDEQEKLTSICDITHLKKGELWLREGQIPKSFAFLAQGILRIYYADDQGSYVTKSFFQKGSVVSAYTAMQGNEAAYFNIEALTETVLVEVNYQKWLEMYHTNSGWKDFLLTLLTKGYIKKERRERELLQLSAEDRYNNFLNEYPDLDKKINQHYIASYLGITPVALSRIRKKMGLINMG